MITDDATDRHELAVAHLLDLADHADHADHRAEQLGSNRQPTDFDRAEIAYKALEIGLWTLGRDDYAEARRWLTTAVEFGVEEARPLLELCMGVLIATRPSEDAIDDAAVGTETDPAAEETAAEDETAPPIFQDTPIFQELWAQRSFVGFPKVHAGSGLVLPHRAAFEATLLVLGDGLAPLAGTSAAFQWIQDTAAALFREAFRAQQALFDDMFGFVRREVRGCVTAGDQRPDKPASQPRLWTPAELCPQRPALPALVGEADLDLLTSRLYVGASAWQTRSLDCVHLLPGRLDLSLITPLSDHVAIAQAPSATAGAATAASGESAEAGSAQRHRDEVGNDPSVPSGTPVVVYPWHILVGDSRQLQVGEVNPPAQRGGTHDDDQVQITTTHQP